MRMNIIDLFLPEDSSASDDTSVPLQLHVSSAGKPWISLKALVWLVLAVLAGIGIGQL